MKRIKFVIRTLKTFLSKVWFMSNKPYVRINYFWTDKTETAIYYDKTMIKLREGLKKIDKNVGFK